MNCVRLDTHSLVPANIEFHIKHYKGKFSIKCCNFDIFCRSNWIWWIKNAQRYQVKTLSKIRTLSFASRYVIILKRKHLTLASALPGHTPNQKQSPTRTQAVHCCTILLVYEPFSRVCPNKFFMAAAAAGFSRPVPWNSRSKIVGFFPWQIQ